MRRALEELMNTIVFCAIATGVGVVTFIVGDLIVFGHVEWY